MKLVIEIDEVRYKDIQRIAEVQLERNHFQTAEQIIAKGVQIEQESDLISRQAVLESLKTDYSLIMFDSYGNFTFAGERIIEAIKGVPSAEPERHLQPTCNQLATDCISRQELLNAISQKEYGHDYDENTDILGLKYVDIIKQMPFVEPVTKCKRKEVLLDEEPRKAL